MESMSKSMSDGRALERELVRLFGDTAAASKHFVLLPLVDEEDAIAFLRTVPTGTPLTELVSLASKYRAANPASTGTLASEDPEAAL
jgi:hypothetical protein